MKKNIWIVVSIMILGFGYLFSQEQVEKEDCPFCGVWFLDEYNGSAPLSLRIVMIESLGSPYILYNHDDKFNVVKKGDESFSEYCQIILQEEKSDFFEIYVSCGSYRNNRVFNKVMYKIERNGVTDKGNERIILHECVRIKKGHCKQYKELYKLRKLD